MATDEVNSLKMLNWLFEPELRVIVFLSVVVANQQMENAAERQKHRAKIIEVVWSTKSPVP